MRRRVRRVRYLDDDWDMDDMMGVDPDDQEWQSIAVGPEPNSKRKRRRYPL